MGRPLLVERVKRTAHNAHNARNHKMELVENVKQRALTRLQSIDHKQAFRLVIIVGGYILLRRLVQRELAKRQLASQIKADNERKRDNLIDRPEDDPTTTTVKEPTAFGWGNKTRYRVQKQQEMLGKAIDNLKEKQKRQNASATGTAYNADSDDDIADLLEE